MYLDDNNLKLKLTELMFSKFPRPPRTALSQLLVSEK